MQRLAAILVFPDVEILDFAGPFEVFGAADETAGGGVLRVVTVAESREAVTTRNGLRVIPDHTLADCPAAQLLVMPGGYGTIDELFEIATLIQTHRIPRFPLILVGRDYWKGLLDWLRSTLEAQGMISAGDLDLLKLADSPEEVLRIITDYREMVGIPESVPDAFR